ncbi:MAG: hypothetical protein J0I63_11420 [Thiobacillus sp.]|nr:hypothetical protein [Thiobacillus sp.]
MAEAHQRHPYRRAVVDPGFKDSRARDDPSQHLAAGAAADRVGGDQTDALRLARFDLRASFLEPVGDEIGAAGDAILVNAVKRI